MDFSVLAGIDWILIILFLLLMLGIGFYFKKTNKNSISDFFVGGKKMPWYLAGLSMVATTFAADTPLAITEIVAESGIAGNWLWWNMAIGGLLTTFFFARLWRRSNVNTELEFITLRYGDTKLSRFLKYFKSVYLGLIMNVLIMAWVNLAMFTILKAFFGIDANHAYLILGILLIVTFVYSSLSGLKGVIFTDAIQFFIAIGGCITLAIILLNLESVGGIDGLKSKLPEETFRFLPTINCQDNFNLEPLLKCNPVQNIGNQLGLTLGTFFAFIGLQWWASWYPGAEPGGGGYVAQRMMSTKNEKHSLWATLFFQIAHYCLRPWPWIIIALCTLILYPDLQDPKEGFVLAMKDHLPSGVKGLLFITFLAAYMSTISTQINWGSSLIINDFIKPIMKSEDEKKLIWYGRIITGILIILSLVVCTRINSIKDTWKILLGCGAGIGMVLMFRWYWWRINVWSELIATLVPFIAYPTTLLIFGPDQDGSYSEAHTPSFYITTLITTVCWVFATIITKPTPNKVLSNFYNSIRPPGWWGKFTDVTIKKKYGLLPLLITWILAIVFVYSFLFLLGSIIFKEYNQAFYLSLLSLSTGISIHFLIKKENRATL